MAKLEPNLMEAIKSEIAAGYISQRTHPTLPLRILNYTPKAQYDWRWNPATSICRGLILDDKDEVVARPFPKFFSLEQLGGVLPQEPYEIYEKMDGSLGILYKSEDSYAIASRGSFESNQACWGTEILREKYSQVPLDNSLTYLFEVIHPENRIVVDYKGVRDLVLLAAIVTSTGEEIPLECLSGVGFPLVKKYDWWSINYLLNHPDNSREGYVLKYASGTRIKIKFEEYKRLHRLMTNVSAKTIWECLSAGRQDDLLMIKEAGSPQLSEFVDRISNQLTAAFSLIDSDARINLAGIPPGTPMKEVAAHCFTKRYPHIMLAIYREKPEVDEMIWELVKPSGSQNFRVRSE